MRKTGIIYVYKHGIVILLMTIGFISLSITGYSAGNGTNKKLKYREDSTSPAGRQVYLEREGF